MEEWHFKAYGTSLNQWKRTAGGTFPLQTPSEGKKASAEYSWRYSWQHQVSGGMSEGQVTVFSVLTSLRFLLDGSPQESSGRALELAKPPGCARGQCSIDPGRWDDSGPRFNQINFTWQRLGSEALFVYVCWWAGVNILSHTLTHYKPLKNRPLAIFYLSLSFQSSELFFSW